MGKLRCSVCDHVDRVKIDNELLNPRISLASIARRVGVMRKTMTSHRDRCLADKASKALEIHRQITVALEAASTGSAIDALIMEAKSDRTKALERGDHRLALRAIDTLLKAHELHARLVIEASNAKARDVTNHPLFQAFVAKQAAVLCTQCSIATAELASRELGLEVPITVHAGVPREGPGGGTP